MESLLTPRWTKLKPHAIQHAFWKCNKRFWASPAGRRSGKTEIAKRKLVRAAMRFYKYPDGRFIFAAPTHAQAEEIGWEDLKRLVPQWAQIKPPSESKRTIHLYNGARLQCFGMDRPERVEGTPVDGIVLDEYANMKPDVWGKHVRPALSTPGRSGFAGFIGVPEGRNHYFSLCDKAKNDPAWGYFHWKTADINPEEAEAARADLDLHTYMQEYEGEFVSFAGRAYYSYGEHNYGNVKYNPNLPIILCFDFNRNPGVACVVQEIAPPDWMKNKPDIGTVTAAVWECWIEPDSNTQKVAQKFLAAFGGVHNDDIYLHGDSSGGAKGSAKVQGSDWDLIEAVLRPRFGHALKHRYPRGNPRIRLRVNAMNSRLRAVDGTVRFLINPKVCPKLCRDFEGVTCDDEGDIEKVQGGPLTHISDGVGYYTHKKFPTGAGGVLKRVAV